MKDQVYIPETEIEMHYFKKMQLLESEIKQLKIDAGKQESYIHELSHRIRTLNGLVKQKNKVIKKYTLLLSEPE